MTKKKKEELSESQKIAVDIFRTLMPEWAGAHMLIHSRYGLIQIDGAQLYNVIINAVENQKKIYENTITDSSQKKGKGKR